MSLGLEHYIDQSGGGDECDRRADDVAWLRATAVDSKTVGDEGTLGRHSSFSKALVRAGPGPVSANSHRAGPGQVRCGWH